eukprot:s1162_g17.t2
MMALSCVTTVSPVRLDASQLLRTVGSGVAALHWLFRPMPPTAGLAPLAALAARRGALRHLHASEKRADGAVQTANPGEFLQATSWTHCSTWVFLTLTAPAWFRQLPSPCSSLPSPFSTDWLYLVRQNRKPWRIFISHHKCSRQLCVTSEDPAQKTGSACNVFLDTDNLRDLTELFNFVRDTETLTILASPGTSASACAVHSAVVRWPNFTDPSATTHEDLSFASPFLVKEDLELSGEGAPSSRQERGFVPDLL